MECPVKAGSGGKDMWICGYADVQMKEWLNLQTIYQYNQYHHYH